MERWNGGTVERWNGGPSEECVILSTAKDPLLPWRGAIDHLARTGINDWPRIVTD
jgi:hypothetical protein